MLWQLSPRTTGPTCTQRANVVATVLRLEVVLLFAFANHQSHYYNSHINNAAEKKRPHIWNDPLLDSGMWNQSFRDF